MKISDILEENQVARIEGSAAYWSWRHDKSKKRRIFGVFT